MNIKRNIIFALESRKKNGVPIVENVPIRMRVIYASQRIEFTTGYRIDVAKWDADKQRVKNGCTNKLKQSASEINADLLKYYAEMQNVFKEFEVQETMPTTQQLKDAFNLRMKESSEEQQEEAPISFWEVFDEFVKECGNQNNWTASTYEKFAAVRNHIKEFKEDVTFEYFNEFGLNEYVNFLRDKKDMRNSTIGKQMGFLKWFLRWSFKKGHHQNIAYDAFKPKLKTTPKKVIFLTWDELNKLKDYQIPHDKQYLERVRDVFLFCCFTSLRYTAVRLRRVQNICYPFLFTLPCFFFNFFRLIPFRTRYLFKIQSASFADKQPHYYDCAHKPRHSQTQVHIAEHLFGNDRKQYHRDNRCKCAHNSVNQRVDYSYGRTQVCRRRLGEHYSADSIARAPVTAHKSADCKACQIRSPLEHTA